MSRSRQGELEAKALVPVMVSARMRDELGHVAYEIEVATGGQVTPDDALEYLIICRMMQWL